MGLCNAAGAADGCKQSSLLLQLFLKVELDAPGSFKWVLLQKSFGSPSTTLWFSFNNRFPSAELLNKPQMEIQQSQTCSVLPEF